MSSPQVSLTSSPNPSQAGSQFTFTATVTANGVPVTTGYVIFSSNNIPGAPNSVNNSGQATESASFPAGSYNIMAQYYTAQNVAVTGANASLTQVVNPPQLTLTSSNNPALLGAPVTFTIIVTPASAGSNGSVRLTINNSPTNLGFVSNEAQITIDDPSILPAGSNTITAQYIDGSGAASGNPVSLIQVVNPMTSITVSSSPSNISYGQNVTLTATITPSSTPGSLTFYITGPSNNPSTYNPYATINNSTGIATTTLENLPAGSYNYYAQYTSSNINAYSSATSATQSFIINKINTTTSVIVSANPTIGQQVTLTATVTPSSPGLSTPTGTVTFNLNGSSNTVTLAGGSNVATFIYTPSTPGSANYNVTYNGDSNYNASQTVNGNFNVGRATPSISLNYAPGNTGTSTYGQSVSFMATVMGVSGVANPSGLATFTVMGPTNTTSSNAQLNSNGVATYTPPVSVFNAPGTYTITATYNDDNNYTPSAQSNQLTQIINKGNLTITMITDSPNPSTVGQSVTISAIISQIVGTVNPSGTITFYSNGVQIGMPVTTSSSTASISYIFPAAGTYNISAQYSGDSNYNSYTSSTLTTQTVNMANTTTNVSHTPVVSFGTPITFTANVAAVSPGTGTPTGTVNFTFSSASGNNSMPITLVNGVATYTTTFGPNTTALDIAYVVSYSGDSNYNESSNGGSININPPNLTISLASSSNPSYVNQPVTFTATVSGPSNAPIPTGSVKFNFINTNTSSAPSSQTVAISNGSSSATVSFTSTGTYTVTAIYITSNNISIYNSGSQTSIPQMVTQYPSSISLISSPNPASVNAPVTFTATVTGISGISFSSADSVTFTIIGPAGASPTTTTYTTTLSTTTSPATATYSKSFSMTGSYMVTATFSGDSNYNSSSTSSPLTQTINAAPTFLTLMALPSSTSYGQSVTLTAVLTTSNVPIAGQTIIFVDTTTGMTLGTGVTNIVGTATLITTTIPVGTNSIDATYAGSSSSGYAGITSNVVIVTVSGGTTSLTLTSSANPSVYGQNVTLTSTVTSPNATGSSLAGTVTFSDNSTVLGTATVGTNGKASLTISTIPVGSNTITATYTSTNGAFTSSTASLSQRVFPDFTTLTVSAPSSVTAGVPVAITAKVSANSPGSGIPTGDVAFIFTYPGGVQAPYITMINSTASIQVTFPTINPSTGKAYTAPYTVTVLAGYLDTNNLDYYPTGVYTKAIITVYPPSS